MDLIVSPYGPSDPPDGLFMFDESRANHAVNFIEKLVVHTKGRHAGQPFILADWQKEQIVRPLFGTVSWDDQYDEFTRQYTIGWIELARKNGKSELLSAFALLGLCGLREESAEVYSVAADRDQAGLVYAVAKRMIELSPTLSKHLEIVDSKKRIIHAASNSFYQVLPGDAAGALGTNPSMVVFDEVLTQKDRGLWDSMRQGFGTRREPLLVAATTAAYTSAQFALEEHKYGERLQVDPLIDPNRFVFMRNLPADWDWTIEGEPPSAAHPLGTGWYYPNPALGDFLNINSLRAEQREAGEKPQAQNSFRVFRLNQWTSQQVRWLDMHVWRECGNQPITREQLKGRDCLAGIDLASSSDFTAWVLLFKGSPTDSEADGYTVLPHFWIPRPAIEKRSSMQAQFIVWEQAGILTVTESNTTDYDVVRAHIDRDATDFNIRLVGYDPWNATQLIGELEAHDMTCVKVPQTAARLNDPSKLLESLLSDRRIAHANNPILNWMADNVQLQVTGDGLMKPSKKDSGDKIDGIAALINALFLSLIPLDDEVVVTAYSFDDDEDDDEDDGLTDDERDELEKIMSAWGGED